MPRFTPDGERNPIQIQRLKDKLGNRSNASSEVEFRGRLGADARRGGTRRADDHRDGQPHPPRLLPRRRRRDAGRRRGGDPPHLAALGLRQAADRAAADAKRARRPRDRVGAGDDLGASLRSRLRSINARRILGFACGGARFDEHGLSGASRLRSSSTGSASAPSRTRARRSSASAATASSRSRGCRASIASRR